MRTLLYFRLNDIATAKLAQARLGELAATSERVTGPWFGQRDRQPVEELPRIEIGQTTYREEAAIAGLFAGAVFSALAVFRYGVSAEAGTMFMATVGAAALGAVIGWWIGGLVGVRIGRFALGRKSTQLAPGQFLMVASTDSKSKESVKRMVNELGGVSIDEHSDLMPNFRWV